MFAWYQQAVRCYVYLSDVSASKSETANLEEEERPHLNGKELSHVVEKKLSLAFSLADLLDRSERPRSDSSAEKLSDLTEEELSGGRKGLPLRVSKFTSSRWFTRGWTLQELLAPREVLFFDDSWSLLGSRSSLVHLLSVTTDVDRDVIEDPTRIRSSAISVATKMSWAAHRTTKRIEDRAYSLLGIFGVHMPLIYGEGNHAFTRLQEQIIRNSDDESIFAWNRDKLAPGELLNLLAPSAAYYDDGARIVGWSDERLGIREPHSLTNQGLRIRVPLLEESKDVYVAILACRYQDDFRGPIGLRLERVADEGSNVYRVSRQPNTNKCVVDLANHNLEGAAQSIYIRQSLDIVPSLGWVRSTNPQQSKTWIRNIKHFILVDMLPSRHWNKEARTMWVPINPKGAAAFSISSPSTPRQYAVIFGYQYSEIWMNWNDLALVVIPFDDSQTSLESVSDAHHRALKSASHWADLVENSAGTVEKYLVKIRRDFFFGEIVNLIDISLRHGSSE
jgi:hypothetical protein